MAFLEKKSYISTSQIMPINREWLTDPVGKLEEMKLWELSFQLIYNLGLMSIVEELALDKIQEYLQLDESAASLASEND